MTTTLREIRAPQILELLGARGDIGLEFEQLDVGIDVQGQSTSGSLGGKFVNLCQLLIADFARFGMQILFRLLAFSGRLLQGSQYSFSEWIHGETFPLEYFETACPDGNRARQVPARGPGWARLYTRARQRKKASPTRKLRFGV